MYSIRAEGDVRQLLRKLHGLENVDIRGVSRVLAETIRASTRDRFKNQKGPDGKAWEPSRRVKQSGGVTLTKTAGLKNSIRSSATADGFAVGTNKAYGRTHQLGEPGREVTIRAKTTKGLIFKIGDRWIRKRQVTVNIKIPARPYLGLSEDDMLEIKATLEAAVTNAEE